MAFFKLFCCTFGKREHCDQNRKTGLNLSQVRYYVSPSGIFFYPKLYQSLIGMVSQQQKTYEHIARRDYVSISNRYGIILVWINDDDELWQSQSLIGMENVSSKNTQKIYKIVKQYQSLIGMISQQQFVYYKF